jgi:hypothetical protein
MNTQTHTQTEAVILAMLTENTGRSMLDSGGAYGRSWERNLALGVEALAKMPAVRFSDGSPVLDMFSFLNEHLEYAAVLDSAWSEFDTARPAEAWLSNLEEFLDTLGVPVDGDFYSEARFSINTYNMEYCLLAQTIQFSFFGFGGNDYMALQIHGGCDVRGGYTKPRIFKIKTSREDFYLSTESAWVSCSSCLVSFDFTAGELEANTENAEGETDKIEAINSRELKAWFWDANTANECPNCGNSGTIAGASK